MAKILVVDDDPFNLKLAATVLAQAGHEVLRAEGFGGYLKKPIRYKAFLASVTALLEGRNA